MPESPTPAVTTKRSHRARMPAPAPFRSATDLTRWLADQAGVVAREQVLTVHGESDATIRRRIRRREWAQVHPGVYVNHTGPLTWLQRAWAAVLVAAPAALCHASAIRAADGPGRRDVDDAPIHVAVARDRIVRPPKGVVVHRISDFEGRVQERLGPPRVRIEHAVIDVADDQSDEMRLIATLADAVRSRRTTAARLLATVDSRRRLKRRDLLRAVLGDVAAGTCSALEQAYLDRVERAHGLPQAGRQVRESAKGTLYRDVEYAVGLLVELDSHLFHNTAAARDRDMERDLDAALTGRDTIRIGWGQAYVRPCATAVKIGELLRQRGWTGRPTTCPRCAPPQCGGAPSPGGGAAPHSAPAA